MYSVRLILPIKLETVGGDQIWRLFEEHFRISGQNKNYSDKTKVKFCHDEFLFRRLHLY